MKLLQIGVLPVNGKITKIEKKRAYVGLLEKWETVITQNQLFDEIKLSFNTYKFFDYPDQKYLKAFIKSVYTNHNGDLYWAGDKYEDFEVLYSALAEQKFIAELTIEPQTPQGDKTALQALHKQYIDQLCSAQDAFTKTRISLKMAALEEYADLIGVSLVPVINAAFIPPQTPQKEA